MVRAGGRAAPRRAILKVAPPFLAVLIGRHVGVFSELRSRPPSPRGASGPVVWTLHPGSKLDGGKSATAPRGVCRSFLMPSWTKSRESPCESPQLCATLGKAA